MRAVELPGDEWLGHVVVGAGLQAGHDVVAVGASGHHDDGHAARAPDLTAYREAVGVGEHEVEQHDVGVDLGQVGEALAPSAASATEKPSSSSASRRTRRTLASSSTSSTRRVMWPVSRRPPAPA